MWEWHEMGFGGGFMWLFWLLVIVAIALLFKASGRESGSSDKNATALDVLERRYAQGEIDESEFNDRKQVLMGK